MTRKKKLPTKHKCLSNQDQSEHTAVSNDNDNGVSRYYASTNMPNWKPHIPCRWWRTVCWRGWGWGTRWARRWAWGVSAAPRTWQMALRSTVPCRPSQWGAPWCRRWTLCRSYTNAANTSNAHLRQNAYVHDQRISTTHSVPALKVCILHSNHPLSCDLHNSKMPMYIYLLTHLSNSLLYDSWDDTQSPWELLSF